MRQSAAAAGAPERERRGEAPAEQRDDDEVGDEDERRQAQVAAETQERGRPRSETGREHGRDDECDRDDVEGERLPRAAPSAGCQPVRARRATAPAPCRRAGR